MSNLVSSIEATGVGICQSVLTAVNAVTSTVNLANTAAAAGNIKANAWLDNVKLSTALSAKDDKLRIFDEVADKIAARKIQRKLAMQNADYATAYAEAVDLLNAE